MNTNNDHMVSSSDNSINTSSMSLHDQYYKKAQKSELLQKQLSEFKESQRQSTAKKFNSNFKGKASELLRSFSQTNLEQMQARIFKMAMKDSQMTMNSKTDHSKSEIGLSYS